MSSNEAPATRVKLRPDRPPIFNRIEDAAARLGVSRSYLYRVWITPGRCEVVKLGTRTLIEEPELQRIAAEVVRGARRESAQVAA